MVGVRCLKEKKATSHICHVAYVSTVVFPFHFRTLPNIKKKLLNVPLTIPFKIFLQLYLRMIINASKPIKLLVALHASSPTLKYTIFQTAVCFYVVREGI